MNDYTLTPVFNTRGIKELTNNAAFVAYSLTDTINIIEDNLLELSNDSNNPENSKGIFKIENKGTGANPTFDGAAAIRPIGIKFNFTGEVIDALKEYTRGFFIVRQKRIPTLLAQGVGIATSKNSYFPMLRATNYFAESFLKLDTGAPKLGRAMFDVASVDVTNNALLCPEAVQRSYIFNNFFNSSEFVLKTPKYSTTNIFSDKSGEQEIYTLDNPTVMSPNEIEARTSTTSNLLLIDPGIELINNGDIKFASMAGNSLEAWTHLDPVRGDINEVASDITWTEEQWSNSVTKVRGEFNSYIGSSEELTFGNYYNIFQKDYDYEIRWKNYFKIRYNDSSPFMPVSDRYSWDNIENSIVAYRGDCYINTYTHRMNWSFIDSELPTNTRVIDPWNWYKNYKVRQTTIVLGSNGIVADNTSGELSGGTAITNGAYKKVLDIFTWKGFDDTGDGEGLNLSGAKLILPDGKKFDKYAEYNGTFGTKYLNRPDINGISVGHWATFKICSGVNLAMRDIDFSRPEEEAVHGTKRQFHPLQKASYKRKLPESNVLNRGISHTLGDKYYFEIPDVPFIKDTFTTRIYYSDPLMDTAFKNGNRIFRGENYQDYTLEHGELVKLIDWFGRLVAVMEHGVLMIPVNERAMMKNQSGEDVYINTANVLPKNPKVLSSDFGSV